MSTDPDLKRLLELAGVKQAVKEFEAEIDPAKKGMFKGKTVKELRSELANIKAEMKSHRDAGEKVPESLRSKLAELDFAIRAKTGWGKVSG